MSRAWFAVLLGVAAVAVAVGAFLVGLQVLDDDRPDPPPAGAPMDRAGAGGGADDDGGDDSGETTGGEGSDTTAPITEPDELTSPAWVLVVSSEGDEARAREVATDVAAAGHPAGVLRSEDHPSLNPGFWVAFAGPYPDADTARAAQPAVQQDGFAAAYLRCAGTTEDCGGDQPLDPAGG